MPRTAGQAHAVARQHYRAMLDHADGNRDLQAAISAGKFANAALLAQMYELRNIRLALMRLAGPDVERVDAEYLETRDLHPATPDVEYDGFAVPRDGAA